MAIGSGHSHRNKKPQNRYFQRRYKLRQLCAAMAAMQSEPLIDYFRVEQAFLPVEERREERRFTLMNRI